MRPYGPVVAVLGAAALAGCAVAPPTGPSVAVMPGKDKSFEAFQADDGTCRQYAGTQIGADPAVAANQSFWNSTVLGTILGGAAGAAIGAATGNPAAGAEIGAGSGLVLGGASGAGAAQSSRISLQQRYDMSYVQCMSAKGEQVPQAPYAAYPAYPGYPGYYSYPSYYYPYRPGYYGSSYINFGFSSGPHFRRFR
jgi:hypothetical protein